MKKVKKKFNNDPDYTSSFKGVSTHDFSKKSSESLKKSSESLKKAKKSKKEKKAKRKSFIGAKFDSNALLENQKVKDVLKKKKKK